MSKKYDMFCQRKQQPTTASLSTSMDKQTLNPYPHCKSGDRPFVQADGICKKTQLQPFPFSVEKGGLDTECCQW